MKRHFVAVGAKKEGAPNQGRSQNPDQGAQKNGTWPTLPFGSAVQAPLLLQEPCGSGWSFSGKQYERLRVVQIVFMAVVAAESCLSYFCQTVSGIEPGA